MNAEQLVNRLEARRRLYVDLRDGLAVVARAAIVVTVIIGVAAAMLAAACLFTLLCDHPAGLVFRVGVKVMLDTWACVPALPAIGTPVWAVPLLAVNAGVAILRARPAGLFDPGAR